MNSSTTLAPARTPAQVYAFVLLGVLATSTAAIFIRFAQGEGLPSLVIAAGRLTLAALLLTPFALRAHRPELAALKRNDLILGAASGLFLAIHFATWIASLEYTSVLISVVFVSTSPLWVALLELVFLRVRLGALVWIGLVIALVGGVAIGIAGDSAADIGSNPVLGGGLALAGAVTIAVYLVIGRKLRAKLSLLPYIWVVYSFAAAFLVAFVILAGLPLTGYAPDGLIWIVLLALVPQLVGHSSFNYALRYLPATFISIATQMEPIASAALALLIFREQPTAAQGVGSLAILAGVLLAIWGQNVKS
jgi:drug/metabolite transporter (DMT)-like permease